MKKTVLIKHESLEWSEEYVAELTPMFPELIFVPVPDNETAMKQAPGAHAIIGIGPQMPPELIAAMANLEWIQTLTTGVDNFLQMEALPSHIPITKISGVHGPQVSELALMMMMSLARRFPAMLEAQKQSNWDRRLQPVLYGKSLCILGLGSIAETLALYASTMGMRVTGVSDGRDNAPHVERIFKRNQICDAVSEADFLVVLVPLSKTTRYIVDAAVLAAMKPTGFLVNLARGGCVDEGALIDALQSGVIAGAGVDVFEQEPLSPDDPIWTAPNIIITPHVAGFADIYARQCLPTVIENLRIYAEAGPGALRSAIPR